MKWFVLFLSLLVVASSFASERTGECLDCHQQSMANRQLLTSAHAGKLGCQDCHGSDHALIDQGTAHVDAAICGRCHKNEYAEHSRSRHGLGLHTGWGCTRNMPARNKQECSFCHREGDSRPISTVQCARFIKQSSEMGQIGCNRCHMIENSCSSCHSNHLTDSRIVQEPAVCAKCHMGPDHPQWEAWQTSQHGTLFSSRIVEDAPGCQTCHMPQGVHDVSTGLTAPPSGKPYAQDQADRQRQKMLDLCQNCHARSFAARDLELADAVRLQTLMLVADARAIIQDLDDRKLLDPQPKTRIGHPQRGQELVLDGAMLYEDISYVESLFFRLNKYAAAKTFKGAYHQNPAYTHWYGNAEVKLLLNDIRGESNRLRERGGQIEHDRKPAQDEDAFDTLQRQHKRGALSDEDYTKKKMLMLEKIIQ